MFTDNPPSLCKAKDAYRGTSYQKVVKSIVMAAGLAAILFTGAFAASETVRVNTLNLAIEVFETNTTFRFGGESGDVTSQFSVGWLPEGYELENYGQDDLGLWYNYQKSEQDWIYISYMPTFGAEIEVDTENAEVEYIDFNGVEAMLTRKDTGLQLVWVTEENTAFLTLMGSEIGKDDLVHIARNLNY